MKDLKVTNVLYEIEGKYYRLNRDRKELRIGTMIYDSVRETFFELETVDDLEKYAYMAPELYGVLEEVKP